MTRSGDENVLVKHYPEVGAGGFTHIDGAIMFYERIHAILPPGATVVDFGAGRGKFREDSSDFRRNLKNVAARAQRSVALDVDPEVLSNESYCEKYLLAADGRSPLEDNVADLVFSDWTLEHVLDPPTFVEEVDRILAPGGWFCARTPNKWGLVGIPTRAVPNDLHNNILRKVVPARKQIDTFPTAYKMNTLRDVNRLFPPSSYTSYSFAADSEPGYTGNSSAAVRLTRLLSRFTPEKLRSTLYLFYQKKA